MYPFDYLEDLPALISPPSPIQPYSSCTTLFCHPAYFLKNPVVTPHIFIKGNVFRMNWSAISELAKFEITNPDNGFESLLIIEGIYHFISSFIYSKNIGNTGTLINFFRSWEYTREFGRPFTNMWPSTIPSILHWTDYFHFLLPCWPWYLSSSNSRRVRCLSSGTHL